MKSQIVLLLLSILFAARFAMAEPLQRFRCEGPIGLREVEIHQDTTQKDVRRLVEFYKNGSSRDVFAKRVKRTDHVAYVEENGEETRYYADTGKLEFWDNQGGAHKVSKDSFAECWSYGKTGKAKEKVQILKAQHFSCIGIRSNIKYVDLFHTSHGWVKLHIVNVNGDTSDELLQVLGGIDYMKLQTKSSQDREKQGRGAGYSSHHVRYFPQQKQLQFWSQGGGTMKAAQMLTVCDSK